MHLGDVAHTEGSQHRTQCKGCCQGPPPLPHSPADIIHGATQVFTIRIPNAVTHGQHHFRVFRRHAEERRNPHPKYGARPAQRNGSGHPGDISGAHGSGQRCADRLERRAAAAPEASAHLPDGGAQFPQLDSPGDPGHQQSHCQQQDHHWRSPDQLCQFLHGHPSSGFSICASPDFLDNHRK